MDWFQLGQFGIDIDGMDIHAYVFVFSDFARVPLFKYLRRIALASSILFFCTFPYCIQI